MFLVGEFIADAIDGPVLVDNPEHPGEAYCSGDIPDYSTYSEADCERPAQLERSPEPVVREAILPFTGYVLAGILLDALAIVGPFVYVVTIPIVGWQWFIATGGVASEAEIGNGQAAVVTGAPLALVLLFSIPMAV